MGTIAKKFNILKNHLDERNRRLWCATEAIIIGRGGITQISIETGLSRLTIRNGIKELNDQEILASGRIRKSGGGRKTIIQKDKTIILDLQNLVESSTRGDPENPLKWTSKSTQKLADELNIKGHKIGPRTVSKILKDIGYSLQANKKVIEGGDHPDRNEQFEFISQKVKEFQFKNQPVISVDCKKKENIGNFKNNGQEYHEKGKGVEVNVYDFLDKEKGKVAPYGIYDLDKNKGWVSVGISSDTAQFAVNSIRSWWGNTGKTIYPEATDLYINSDGGGSNGSRNRLWKKELQTLADETSLNIHVSHFPPGTSKWNKIEHRMFSFISKNWRGRPLIDTATVINLIANTTTKKGLKIIAQLDENIYQTGIKISDEEMSQINLIKEEFHGEWNYIIKHRK